VEMARAEGFAQGLSNPKAYDPISAGSPEASGNDEETTLSIGARPGDEIDKDKRQVRVLGGKAPTYHIYGRRWMMLAIYCFNICVAYIPYYTFVPILLQSMRAYDVTEARLNYLSIVYPLASTPCIFLTGASFERYGCRGSFVFASALLVLGCWLRWEGNSDLNDQLPAFSSLGDGIATGLAAIDEVSNATVLEILGSRDPHNPAKKKPLGDFQRVLAGQFLCAVGLPFFVNGTSQMSLDWFPPEERSTASMLSNLMNFIGGSASFVLPAIFLAEGEMARPAQEEWAQIQTLLCVQLVLAVISLLMTVVLYEGRPPTPPAPAADGAREEQLPFLPEILSLLKMRDFWIIVVQFGFYLAAMNAFDAVEGSLLVTYGHSSMLCSYSAISFTVSAILSTLMESRLIDSPTMYRRSLVLMQAVLAVSFVIMSFGFREGVPKGVSASVFVFSVFVMGWSTPGWGCSVELCCEVSYPAREGTTSSLLEGIGNLLSIAGIQFLQWLIDSGHPDMVLWCLVAMGAVGGCIVQCAPKEALLLRRHTAEELVLKGSPEGREVMPPSEDEEDEMGGASPGGFAPEPQGIGKPSETRPSKAAGKGAALQEPRSASSLAKSMPPAG